MLFHWSRCHIHGVDHGPGDLVKWQISQIRLLIFDGSAVLWIGYKILL